MTSRNLDGILLAKMSVLGLIQDGLLEEKMGIEIVEFLDKTRQMRDLDAYTRVGLRQDYEQLARYMTENRVLFNVFKEIVSEFREEIYLFER